MGYAHFDSDSYFWLPTANPFTIERDHEACMNMMHADLLAHDRWILSGSLTNWGDELIPYFDLAVFVYVPPELRMERLRKREHKRYGDAILDGGSRYNETRAFLDWAAAYDDATQTGRSLKKHEDWLKGIACATLRIVNVDLNESAESVLRAIGEKIN